MPLPITKARIQHHFHYSLWKYILLIALSIFGWNLLFTTTHYRSPEDKKVEFYADGYYDEAAGANMDALLEKIHSEVMPEMEEVTMTMLTIDETYGNVQLTVWVSAGQGDVYLLFHDRFLSLAQGGAFIDLQPYIDQGLLHVEGIDLTRGQVRDEETGMLVQCGIPADSLKGLYGYGVAVEEATFGILASSGNEEYAVRFLDYLLTHMGEEPPAT